MSYSHMAHRAAEPQCDAVAICDRGRLLNPVASTARQLPVVTDWSAGLLAADQALISEPGRKLLPLVVGFQNRFVLGSGP